MVDLSNEDLGDVLKEVSRLKGYQKYINDGNIPILAFVSKSQYDMIKFLHIDISSMISKAIMNMNSDNDGSCSPDFVR